MLNLHCNGTPKWGHYVLCWPQLGLPLQPVFVFDKTKFFADPNLDSRYNLYLEFDKTKSFADPKLDSRYNLYLEFDKTMFFADPNLDSRYNLYLYLIRLCW